MRAVRGVILCVAATLAAACGGAENEQVASDEAAVMTTIYMSSATREHASVITDCYYELAGETDTGTFSQSLAFSSLSATQRSNLLKAITAGTAKLTFKPAYHLSAFNATTASTSYTATAKYNNGSTTTTIGSWTGSHTSADGVGTDTLTVNLSSHLTSVPTIGVITFTMSAGATTVCLGTGGTDDASAELDLTTGRISG